MTPFSKAGLTQIFSQVHVLSAHLSTIVKECAQLGKTPDIRLDKLPTAITGLSNVNKYHRLGF